MSKWTLFSNHGHVLLFLSRDSEVRLRDVAANVGITERAVQKIVRDLQDASMLTVTKHGRRNRYRIHLGQHLRHDLESHCTVGQLIDLISGNAPQAEPHTLPGSEPAVAKPAPPAEPDIEPTPDQPQPAPEQPQQAPEQPSEFEPDRTPGEPPASDPGEQGSLF